MTIHSSNNWKIDLPKHWEVEIDDEIHIIYDPDGFGALQISAFIKSDDPITENELLENTGLEENDFKYLKKVSCGDFDGYLLMYDVDHTFWKKWWLIKDNLLLFATYNCETTDREKELNFVDTTVNSLTIIKKF